MPSVNWPHRSGRSILTFIASRIARRIQAIDDIDFLRAIATAGRRSGLTTGKLDAYLEELASYSEMRSLFEKHQSFFPDSFDDRVVSRWSWYPLLYALVREFRPDIAVESGCATGLTTSIILKAMEMNGVGRLYSIDLRMPDVWLVREGLETGFLIPENVRHRWTFIERDLVEALPELLMKLNKIDLFLHDSDHSYIHQMWEYLTAWRYLKVGGVLASDDISHNLSFWDFGMQIRERTVISRRGRNFGAVRKDWEVLTNF